MGGNFFWTPLCARFELFLSLLLLFCALNASQSTTNQSEMEALSEMYYATNGLNWKWKQSPNQNTIWNFSRYENGTYIYDPCLDLWQGVQCFSGRVTGYRNIYRLSLPFFNIKGPLVDALGNLSELRYMNLSHNRLVGAIPRTFLRLTNLERLNLDTNKLTGSLPSWLSGLKRLTHLALGDNGFTGSIENEFYSMHNLKYLQLNHNNLTGTISPQVDSLRRLDTLILSHNHFSGSLPRFSPNRSHGSFNYLELSNNHFNGTLPSYFLYDLAFALDLTTNFLSGTVPENPNPNLFSVPLILSIARNSFEGTIPRTLLNSQSIYQLYIGSNSYLHGPLPDILHSNSRLNALDFAYSHFSGTLPESFSLAKQLRLLYGHYNDLEGSIPESWMQLDALQSLDLSKNQLDGQLCENLGLLQNLTYLFLNDNKFNGTLPSSFRLLANLNKFDLSNNLLQGTLSPQYFAAMTQLDSVLLQSNQFSGSISPDLFIQTTHRRLTSILLGDNQLTGTIPGSLFQLPYIRNVSLLKNCFHGPLPIEMCECRSLVSVVMDGLSSAEVCRTHIFDPLKVFKGYISRVSMSSSLPSCLWKLPNLRELHLSGNSLTGNLGDLDDFDFNSHSSQLTDVYLSYNLLTGTIPRAVQEAGQLRVLDLSSNLLTGHISYFTNLTYTPANWTLMNITHLSHSPLQRRVAVSSNYLSGPIPAAFRDASDVDILLTNHFDCSSFDSNGPVNDPNYDGYVCGSTHYNYALISAAVIVGVCLLLVLLAVRWKALLPKAIWPLVRALIDLVEKQDSQEDPFGLEAEPSEHAYFATFIKAIFRMREIIWWLTLYSMFVCLPTYVVLNHWSNYTLYQDTYGWATTAVYLEGLVPMAVCTVLWAIALAGSALFLWRSHLQIEKYHQTEKTVQSAHLEMVDSEGTSSLLGKGSLQRNLKGFLRADIAYFSKAILLICFNCSVNLAINVLFVLATNDSGSITASTTKDLSYLALSLFKIVWNIGLVKPSISLLRMGHHLSVTVILFMLVFNLLLAPMLAIAFSDPSCFQEFFFGTSRITIDYGSLTCMYSSKMFTENRPSLYTNYTLSCQYGFDLKYATSYQPEFIYTYSCGSEVLSLYIPIYIVLYTILLFIVPSFVLLGCLLPSRWLSPRVLALIPSIMRPQDKGRNLSRVDPYVIYSIQLNLLVYLLLLLTFGLFAPLFALVCMASMFTFILAWKFVLLRFIYYENPASVFYLDGLVANFQQDIGEGTEENSSVRLTELRTLDTNASPLHEFGQMDVKADHSKASLDMQSTMTNEPLPPDQRQRVLNESSAPNSLVFSRPSILLDPEPSMEMDHSFSRQLGAAANKISEHRLCLINEACTATWEMTLSSTYIVLSFCGLFYFILLVNMAF